MALALGVALAGVSLVVALPLLSSPALARVVLSELAAFPLYAAAGVGLGILVSRSKRRRLLVPLFLMFWSVTTLTGLIQDDEFDAWPWLLWAVPFVAAGTAIALAGLSADVWEFPPVPVGDWGRSATIALLVSAAAYAMILNLLAVTRRSGDRPPAGSPAAGSGPTGDAHP